MSSELNNLKCPRCNSESLQINSAFGETENHLSVVYGDVSSYIHLEACCLNCGEKWKIDNKLIETENGIDEEIIEDEKPRKRNTLIVLLLGFIIPLLVFAFVLIPEFIRNVFK